MTRTFKSVGLLVGVLAFASVAHSQQVDPQSIRMMAVGDNIGLLFLFSDTGGHSLAFGGEDEKIVLIDPKGPGTASVIAQKLRNGADGKITTIINTNAHRAASNGEYQAVDIIAHENTKAAMAKMSTFQGANAKALPTKLLTDKLSLTVKTVGEQEGTNRIDLYYFGRGHTNGDIVVVFPSLNTVYLGDLFPGRSAPAIDTANGGSAVALADTLEKALATLQAIPGLKIVIPGPMPPPPGPYVPRWLALKDFQEYVEFNREFLSAVKAAIAAGKTPDEAAASLKLPERFQSYGMEQARANVRAIYAELSK